MIMTSKLHDTLRGKPTSPLSSRPHLPFASSPSAGPRWSPPFFGRLCTSLRALSRLFACSSCCPSFSPSVPLLPWHVARHCTRLFPLSGGWSSRLRLYPAHACCPAARGTPPWHPFTECRLSTCMSPHLGLPQYSSVPHSVTVRKLHATLHYCLLPCSLSLSFPLSPALCLPFGPSLFALPLTRTLHNNVQGTLSSPCPGPSCRCAHGALQPSRLRGPSDVCPLTPLCPCLVPSASLPSLARSVPSFPLVLCPTPTPCAPPPSEHDARHSPFLGAHDTRHDAWLAPLWPLFPPSLPVRALPCARYTTRCWAPFALILPLLALARPHVPALFPLQLPPLVRARCRALCLASPLPLFALVRRLCPLGPSVFPALARCLAALPSPCTGHDAGTLHARYIARTWAH